MNLGAAICSALAFGFSFNMYLFRDMAIKERWNVPPASLMSAPQIIGRIGIFLSLILGGFSSGMWGLLITPGGGLLIGGVGTAVLRENSLIISLYVWPICLLTGAVLLFALPQ